MLLMAGAANSTLASTVEARVRDWIRDGTLERGELYSVQQLSDWFETSRSPVREGLLAVAEAGLIEFTRNRGFRIVVPGARDVAEIFGLRLALEPPAAHRAASTRTDADACALARSVESMEKAADRADPATFAAEDQRLHQQIMRIAGNGRAARVIESMRDATRVLGPSTAGRSRSLHEILGEHRPFVDAIIAHDAADAERSMRRHLVATGHLLVRQCYDDGDSDAFVLWDAIVDEA